MRRPKTVALLLEVRDALRRCIARGKLGISRRALGAQQHLQLGHRREHRIEIDRLSAH